MVGGEEGVDGSIVLKVFIGGGRWFFEGTVVGCRGVAVGEPDAPGGWFLGCFLGGLVGSLGVGGAVGLEVVDVVVVEEVTVFSDLSVVLGGELGIHYSVGTAFVLLGVVVVNVVVVVTTNATIWTEWIF